MRMIFTAGAMTIAIAATPALAEQSGARVFEASSDWAIDRQNESCVLQRSFASGATSLILQLNSDSLGNYFDVILAGTDLNVDKGQVTYQFVPDTDSQKPPNPKVGSFGGGLKGVSFTGSMREPVVSAKAASAIWPVAERHRREASITGLLVDGAFKPPVLLKTGPMDGAMGAMRSCVDELHVGWGFDPQVARGTASRASRVNTLELTRRVLDAYPRELAKSGISARVKVVVSIGPDGRPTRCYARNPEGQPKFEAAACETVMKHARYEPAQDAAGNDVADLDGFYVTFSPD